MVVDNNRGANQEEGIWRKKKKNETRLPIKALSVKAAHAEAVSGLTDVAASATASHCRVNRLLFRFSVMTRFEFLILLVSCFILSFCPHVSCFARRFLPLSFFLPFFFPCSHVFHWLISPCLFQILPARLLWFPRQSCGGYLGLTLLFPPVRRWFGGMLQLFIV